MQKMLQIHWLLCDCDIQLEFFHSLGQTIGQWIGQHRQIKFVSQYSCECQGLSS